ncbi:S49 family peptidase [Falsiroseomonas sp. CW058]|uniref:S49 family peptidase n=1 Tax=Falsiroseomonas sp. CW058 TaxID=3388664 RepID=UPI003D31AD50
MTAAAHGIDPRLANTPLLLDPRAWPQVSAAIEALGSAPPAPRDRIGYDLVAGIAVIEVSGVLVNRLGDRRSWGFVTGYDGIRANLMDALDDPEAKAIAFLVNSPGGMVSGLPDLAALIRAARGVKPLWAILDDSAFSAAYWIASACDRVTVPETGGAGSIGVITALVDISAMLKADGIAPHFITFGKRKAAELRASYTGMTADVLDALQADVDRLGEMFVAAVARNRAVQPGAIRRQEAACFMGQLAVEARLADEVCSADAAFLALRASLA